MLFHELVQTSRRVAETRGRLAKIELVAALLKRAGPDEIGTAIADVTKIRTAIRIGTKTGIRTEIGIATA